MLAVITLGSDTKRTGLVRQGCIVPLCVAGMDRLIKAEGCGAILSRRRLRGSLTVSVLAVITLGGEMPGEQAVLRCVRTHYVWQGWNNSD